MVGANTEIVINKYEMLISLIVSFAQDGGSLDLVLKRSGRIPEPILGIITTAVSETEQNVAVILCALLQREFFFQCEMISFTLDCIAGF